VVFVSVVDDQALALWSPLSPLASPVRPTPDQSGAEKPLTPATRPAEPTRAKSVEADEAQAEVTHAAPVSVEVKQDPARRPLLGGGLIVLGLVLVIGGVFWLVRRR